MSHSPLTCTHRENEKSVPMEAHEYAFLFVLTLHYIQNLFVLSFFCDSKQLFNFYVSLFVCFFVCLSASISQEPHL